MERRGVYRKGSAGHPRNVSPYFLARQKMKKWRYPLTALFALMIVFGTAPVVGEEFQASLLTSDETAQLVLKNPEQARKTILNSLHEFLKDCERFKMTECSEKGKALISDIVHSGSRLPEVLSAVTDFEDHFENDVAMAACKYDLGKLVLQGKSAQKSIQKFFDRYGQALESQEFSSNAAALKSVISGLDKVVDFCASR